MRPVRWACTSTFPSAEHVARTATSPRQCASRFGHDDYAAVVVAELARARLVSRGKRPELAVDYFGGGTPGLWRPQAIGRVIETTRRAFDATGPLEITVEANPGEVTAETAAGLRAAG